MPVEIQIKCSPASGAASDIRGLFCALAAREPVPNWNPLVETNFNKLLEKIAQVAFEEGRQFQKDHPDI